MTRETGGWARISCVLNMDSSVNFGFGAKNRDPAPFTSLHTLMPYAVTRANYDARQRATHER